MKLLSFFLVSDKVFGPTSQTESVYEDGVKNVALSALMGINGKHVDDYIKLTLSGCHFSIRFNVLSLLRNCFHIIFAATIFAYGQTSSGKTYTMRGITEKAVNDIYKHIMNVSFIIVL